jgi:hypothetical protein
VGGFTWTVTFQGLDGNVAALTCDATNSISTTATSNIVLDGNTKTIYFDASNNTLKNLSITGSNTIYLGNALNITGGSSFGVVTVSTLATLRTGDSLTLKSDANGTACIGNPSGTILGNVTVERYIPALSISGIRGRYRFLSSPLTNATLADWQGETHITGNGGASNGFDSTNTNAPSVYWYEETKGGGLNTRWTAATATTGYDLVNGRGYRVFIRGDRTASRLLGTFNNPAPDQNAITLNLTGTLTSSVNVIIPDSVEKVYTVKNSTSGAFAVTFKTTSGSGATFAAADKGVKLLYSDGTNVTDVNSQLKTISLFTLPTADGTSGQVIQTNGSAQLSFVTPFSTGKAIAMAIVFG